LKLGVLKLGIIAVSGILFTLSNKFLTPPQR